MQTVDLPLDQLLPPVVIMRDDMDQAGFKELTDDIRAHGVEQPLIVCRLEDKYRVVAGWRRKLAAEAAEMLTVPCVVKDLDEAQEVEVMLRENLHRENPSPLDEGKMFCVMNEGLHLTPEGIAQRVGKSVSFVRSRMAVMRGPEKVVDALRTGHITLSVALELQRCTAPEDLDYCLYWAISGGATADLVQRWVRERNLARAAGETGAAPSIAPSSAAPSEVMLGRCDWHRGQVPLDGVLGFHLCGSCYLAINHLYDVLAKGDVVSPAELQAAVRSLYVLVARKPEPEGEEVTDGGTGEVSQPPAPDG